MLGESGRIGPALIALASVLPASQAAAVSQAERPNIVLVILDDVGLDFLELYDEVNVLPAGVAEESPLIYPRLPVIEALAAGGVRFDCARVNPSCSSTRASLFSGRYAFRHGIGALVRPADTSPAYGAARTLELGVGPGNREWTLAHFAAAAGYQTFFCGKYHVSLSPERQALEGRPGLGARHCTEVAGWQSAWCVIGNVPGYYNYKAFSDGEQVAYEGEYVTTVQADRAIEFVRSRTERPWLLTLAFSAAHGPYRKPPPELVTTAAYLENELSPGALPSDWKLYCATLEALDRELGRVVEAVREAGALERTLFVVVGDNGTPLQIGYSLVTSKRVKVGPAMREIVSDGRLKHQIYEAGVRVPLVVSGAGVARPGRSSRSLVDAPDVFATLVELMGIDPADIVSEGHHLDGISLTPILQGTSKGTRRFSLTEHFEPNGDPREIEYRGGKMGRYYMLRRGFVIETEAGRFKLVRNQDQLKDPRFFLYHLADADGNPVDPWEQRPLKNKQKRNGQGSAAGDPMFEARAALKELLATEPAAGQ